MIKFSHKRLMRIIKKRSSYLVRGFRTQLTECAKDAGGLLGAIGVPLETVERHIRGIGLQQ